MPLRRTLSRKFRGAGGEQPDGGGEQLDAVVATDAPIEVLLEGVRADGWRALHEVDLGLGVADHVLVGPAGLLTVQTECRDGDVEVSSIDEAIQTAAYMKAKALERAVGRPADPLLVVTGARLDRPVTRRGGVTILGAGALADHLARLEPELSPRDVTLLYAKLSAAFEGDVADAA